MDTINSGTDQIDCDVHIIGVGTVGSMATLKGERKNSKANVVLLDKANINRLSAISTEMDGLNNSVLHGFANPEQYSKEITVANDGICDQTAVFRYAQECYRSIEGLDKFGICFQKDNNGEYDVTKVHRIGTYVLPMPNGGTVKKVLYRQLRKAQINIVNCNLATRLLRIKDQIAGAITVNTRSTDVLFIHAKSVIMCLGAAGRLGLPSSGYLYGTYKNASNSGEAIRWPCMPEHR